MRAAVLTLAYLALLWAGAAWAPSAGVWLFGVLVLAMAAPLALLGAYRSAVRRAHLTVALARDGWLFRTLSGAVLRVGLNALGALVLAFVAAARLIGQSGWDWAALVVAALAVLIATRIWHGTTATQIAPTYRLAVSIHLGRVVGLLAGLISYLAVMSVALDGQPPSLPDISYKSALTAEITQIGAQWQWLEAFALGRLSALGDWGRVAAALTVVLANLTLIWVISGISAAMLLPRAAWAIAFAPIGRSAPTRDGLAWIAAVVSLLVLFVYLPSLAGLEAGLRALPPAQRPSQVFVTQVEDIGGQFFEPGTIAEITGRQATEVAALTVQSRDQLTAAVNAGFDAMNANVDSFLDWYYSLPAEYARIGHLLAGDFEEYVSKRLQQELTQGAPFAVLQQTIAQIEAEHVALNDALSPHLTELSQARRVQLSDSQPVRITERAPTFDALLAQAQDPLADIRAQLQRRLVQTGGSAGMAGLLTATVMVKIGSKGVAKVAAKAAVKVATSKAAGGAAGAGAGAFAGGLIGSVFPGVGTALGAVVGGALGGVAVGVGVDALLLELEETLQRDDLARDIFAALDDARGDVLALIGASLEEN